MPNPQEQQFVLEGEVSNTPRTKRTRRREASEQRALKRLRRFDELVREQQETELVSAIEADAVGYMCRGLVQATLPHKIARGAKINEFTRTNGDLKLTIMAPSDIGIPYGGMPRMLLAYMNRLAILAKVPELDLGRSLRAFLLEVGYGDNGATVRLMKAQAIKLFSSTILMSSLTQDASKLKKYDVATEAVLWWNPINPDQASLWNSYVKLTPGYFRELVEHPVPVDLRVLSKLKRSPMAMDTYCWLTHRMSYLRDDTPIPWELLMAQFGAGYSSIYDFKANFKLNLVKVLGLYPEARVDEIKTGLMLKRSPTHVPRTRNLTKDIIIDPNDVA